MVHVWLSCPLSGVCTHEPYGDDASGNDGWAGGPMGHTVHSSGPDLHVLRVVYSETIVNTRLIQLGMVT